MSCSSRSPALVRETSSENLLHGLSINSAFQNVYLSEQKPGKPTLQCDMTCCRPAKPLCMLRDTHRGRSNTVHQDCRHLDYSASNCGQPTSSSSTSDLNKQDSGESFDEHHSTRRKSYLSLDGFTANPTTSDSTNLLRSSSCSSTSYKSFQMSNYDPQPPDEVHNHPKLFRSNSAISLSVANSSNAEQCATSKTRHCEVLSIQDLTHRLSSKGKPSLDIDYNSDMHFTRSTPTSPCAKYRLQRQEEEHSDGSVPNTPDESHGRFFRRSSHESQSPLISPQSSISAAPIHETIPETCIAPCTPISISPSKRSECVLNLTNAQVIAEVTDKDTSTDPAMEPNSKESACRPKLLKKSQIPAFTTISHPPSVIVSDHSHDELLPAADEADQTLNYTPSPWCDFLQQPKTDRKMSESSGSEFSILSSDSSYSIDDDEYLDTIPARRISLPQNRWKTVKNAIIFVPFMQKWVKNGGEERSYAWVQLAGHKGNFLPGENGTILKKMCSKEHRCLQLLMNDILRPYCAKFYDVVEKGGDKYIRMEDLLGEFDTPTVMDCKMGVRTYLESELAKAKVEPTPRKDMYEKMIKIDANEPTAEEHAQKALLKPRYMQWRESISSTVTEGFRIEGIQIDKTMNKDFKTTKSREQVKATLRGFISDNTEVVAKYVTRLNAIHSTLITSKFFMSHEMIGSSLLFVHDRHGKAGIWLIDFGKTIPLPEGVTITHRSPWVECNHEDGYLTGIENLRDIFKELLAEVNGTNADEAGGEVTSQQTT